MEGEDGSTVDEGVSLEGEDGSVGVEEGVVGEGFSVLVAGREGERGSEETEGEEDTEEEGVEGTVTALLQEQSRTATTTRKANKRIFFM